MLAGRKSGIVPQGNIEDGFVAKMKPSALRGKLIEKRCSVCGDYFGRNPASGPWHLTSGCWRSPTTEEAPKLGTLKSRIIDSQCMGVTD